MGRFFSMDSKFFTVMSRVADLVMLNLIFLLCCIPIVTIGASVTALNYVTLKMARNEESYIIKGFFKSFKENFKQSTIIWLIVLITGVILVIDFIITNNMSDDSLMKIMRYILYAVSFVYAMTVSYIFPILAKFENSIKNTFKNAVLMAIRHLPWTILLVIVTFVPTIITMLIPEVFVYGSLVWFLAGFSLTALINAYIFVRIFDNYIPQEEIIKDEFTEEV